MARHLRLTVALALCGIALALAVLARMVIHKSTVLVPIKGGTYTEAVVGAPQWLNPVLASFNEVDEDLCHLLFRGLTRVDENLRLVPDLAQNWETTGDGLVYTFTLRSGLKWQDGAPVAADDVVYTIHLMQSPDFPGPPYLSDLWKQVQVEQTGDLQVRFTLSEPYAPFLDYTTVGLLPSHLLGEVEAADLLRDPFNLSPVGNGPLVLEELSAEQAVFAPNPNYGGPSPLLDEIVMRFYSDRPSALVAYENGEVDGIRSIPPEYLDQAARLTTLNLYSSPRSEAVWLLLNTKTPPLDDAPVRRALSLAIDREAVIDDAVHGQGIPIYGPLLPSSWAYNPAVANGANDAVAARNLLVEAGWGDSDGNGILDKDGKELSIEVLTPEVQAFANVAEQVAAQWKQIGVQATVAVVSQGELAENHLRSRDFQVALYYWMNVTPDPDLYPFLHSTQAADPGQNFTQFNNRDADEIMEEARRSVDIAHRQESYAKLQEILRDQAPIIALYQPVYTMGVSDRVQGVTLGPLFTPSDRFRSISDWYIYTQRVVASQATNPLPVP
jgi:peptide/nickel transport system substrate-binding protein